MPSDPLVSYREGAALLEAYGIPLAPARLVNTAYEAALAASALGFPVALKAIAPELTHKSDAGLVRLNLDTAVGVRDTALALLHATAQHELEGLLVQRMAPAGVEMLVGLTADATFGPVLALGSGGVLVELLDDVVLRLPPLTPSQAAAMLRETRSWRLLQGFRGGPPASVAALVELLMQLSRLAVEQAARLLSLDLNPVIVLPDGQGVQVVDFRLTLRVPGHTSSLDV
ncbi:MAG: acetate--CoA ligase family protein [Ardenticatenaceae bacterium]